MTGQATAPEWTPIPFDEKVRLTTELIKAVRIEIEGVGNCRLVDSDWDLRPTSSLGASKQIQIRFPEGLRIRLSVDELDLTVRARNCLESAVIKTVGELVSRNEQDLLSVRSFGRTSLREVKRRLEELGLSLGMQLPDGHEVSAPVYEASDEPDPFDATAETVILED